MQNMIYNGYPVTDEQQSAIDWAMTHGSQSIEACAGAGKTSTLGAISECLSGEFKRGLYIAFNKSIANEANRKMPSNVEARTAHSLAYRAAAVPFYNAGKMAGRPYPNVIARTLNIAAIPPMTPTGTAALALEAVTRFCYSADDEIKHHHVNLKEFRGNGYNKGDLAAIEHTLWQHANMIWSKMIDLKDPMPITHDVYLKLWCLTKPALNYDFILFDEAQDANPVLLDLVMRQSAQIILVGDRYQQIYSWRGATNAMQSVQMQTNRLTQSFRFGDAIADVANHILNEQVSAGVNIRGFSKIESQVCKLSSGQADCIITRTNSGLFSELFYGIDKGHRIAINGGAQQLLQLIKEMDRLRSGGRSEHADLRAFADWGQLIEHSETDLGKDFLLPIKLMDDYGVNSVVAAIQSTENNAYSHDYMLTTAHKSKGLEWNNVILGSDFRARFTEDGDENQLWSPEEANLLYVAATRAQNKIDVSNVSDIAHLHPSTELAGVA